MTNILIRHQLCTETNDDIIIETMGTILFVSVKGLG